MPILGLSPSSKPVYPIHFDIESVIRPNILSLHPYRCARDDYQEGILLDANENALGHSISANSDSLTDEFLQLNLNRYPDPAQVQIKQRLAELRGLDGPENIFLGVGSDEVIDLLMRISVAPGMEKVLTTPPTYGMYGVAAQVNDIEVVKVPLNVEGGAFQLQLDKMKETIDSNPSIKLIFLCSPGNPTGTLIPLKDVEELLNYPKFKGIVIVDEAYIDFAGDDASAVSLISRYANLCVIQTLSKSFGLAAIRLGAALAQPPLIQVLTNTKAPYNISTPSAHLALSALSPQAVSLMREKAAELVASRRLLIDALKTLSAFGLGHPLGGNHANFVVVPILNRETGQPDNERSQKVYKTMAESEKVVIRYRGSELGCKGCLRITVGSAEENRVLVERLKDVLQRV